MFEPFVNWWTGTFNPWIDRVLPDREIFGNGVERWLAALGLLLGLWLVFRFSRGLCDCGRKVWPTASSPSGRKPSRIWPSRDQVVVLAGIGDLYRLR